MKIRQMDSNLSAKFSNRQTGLLEGAVGIFQIRFLSLRELEEAIKHIIQK